MSKFEAFAFDDDGTERSECEVSCCGSEQQCLNEGGCTDLDITSEESLSFSLQDSPSLCEDIGDMVVSQNISGSTDVGSTMFQDFLMCFDERDLLLQQRAVVPNPAAFLLSQRYALQVQPSNSSAIVSLPQFRWQPAGGLFCQPEVKSTSKNEEALVLSEEEQFDLSDDEDSLHDNQPLLKSESLTSSFGESGTLAGGTLKDPRYVPRPSSTTSGLKEMSKFFRTLSTAEDVLGKQSVQGWADKLRIEGPTRSAPSDGCTRSAATSVIKSEASKSEVPQNTKDTSAPPLGHFLQQRSRSDLKISASPLLSPSLRVPLLKRSRTEEAPPRTHVRHSSDDGGKKSKGKVMKQSAHIRHASDDLGKKGKGTLMNFLRKTKLPSFKKTHFSSHCSLDNSRPKESKHKSILSKSASDGGEPEDVANILASLNDVLNEQGTSRQHPSQSQRSNIRAPSPQHSEPLSTLASGNTHSDTSSLFGGIQSDEDSDSCFSDDDSFDADTFFSTPYYSTQERWNKDTAGCRSFAFGHRQRPYASLQDKEGNQDSWDAQNMLTFRHELTRCSSIDTAKASNLSCDPAADRARLLEIQACMMQQREEEEKRLNAPPIEFEAGDNVIHVRAANCETIDAACEIEVLPKRELQSHKGRDKMPPTAAEF